MDLLVERNIDQPTQLVKFVQSLIAGITTGEPISQQIDLIQTVAVGVDRTIPSIDQTVDFIQTVVSPVIRLRNFPGQTVDFVQTVSVSTDGFEQVLQTVKLVQTVDLTY